MHRGRPGTTVLGLVRTPAANTIAAAVGAEVSARVSIRETRSRRTGSSVTSATWRSWKRTPTRLTRRTARRRVPGTGIQAVRITPRVRAVLGAVAGVRHGIITQTPKMAAMTVTITRRVGRRVTISRRVPIRVRSASTTACPVRRIPIPAVAVVPLPLGRDVVADVVAGRDAAHRQAGTTTIITVAVAVRKVTTRRVIPPVFVRKVT